MSGKSSITKECKDHGTEEQWGEGRFPGGRVI